MGPVLVPTFLLIQSDDMSVAAASYHKVEDGRMDGGSFQSVSEPHMYLPSYVLCNKSFACFVFLPLFAFLSTFPSVDARHMLYTSTHPTPQFVDLVYPGLPGCFCSLTGIVRG